MKSLSAMSFGERNEVDAHLTPTVGRDERVVGEQAHPEREGTLRDELADPTEADDPEHLVVQLDALPARALPAALLERRVRLRDVASLREQQRQRVLGRGQHVRLRRVHHHHAAARRRLDVDVVEADAGAADHDEVGAGLEHLRGHLGRGTDHQRMRAGDDVEQL